METRDAKFELGEIVITPAVSAALAAQGGTVDDMLARHRAGDWGDVSEQVRAVNERGIVEHFNLQSAYAISPSERIVVMTNRQRTMTMVHLDTVPTDAPNI